ncbi:hypothetical protein [Streptomyces sp. NPDC051567]|uniref:hypothetical protein n=1 Tax=Streptomyces sp. NPDC051567 TaxID=3365660 RepID=UPI00378D9198
MRPARDRDSAPAVSHTPIFDKLYAEYLRAFRTLPGDRTGEEDLGFAGFSYGSPYAGGGYGHAYGVGGYGYGGRSGSAWQQPEPWQPSYTPLPQPSYAQPRQVPGGPGHGDGRQHQNGTHHVPPALPPAPRRGY